MCVLVTYCTRKHFPSEPGRQTNYRGRSGLTELLQPTISLPVTLAMKTIANFMASYCSCLPHKVGVLPDNQSKSCKQPG